MRKSEDCESIKPRFLLPSGLTPLYTADSVIAKTEAIYAALPIENDWLQDKRMVCASSRC